MKVINALDPDLDIENELMTHASPGDALSTLKARKLIELIKHLKTRGPTQTVCVCSVSEGLILTPFNTSNKVSITVWVDWRDRAPLRHGLPETHYRMQIRRGNAPLSQDERASTPEDAEEAISQAFGWSNRD